MRRITKLHPPTGVMYVEHSASQPVESLLVVDLAAEDNPLVLYHSAADLCARVFGLRLCLAAEHVAGLGGLTACDATNRDILAAVGRPIEGWPKEPNQ